MGFDVNGKWIVILNFFIIWNLNKEHIILATCGSIMFTICVLQL
jgi:hypothetical protein